MDTLAVEQGTPRQLGLVAARHLAFSKCAFLKKANENVTVIEKTEQVIVKEEDSIGRIISRPSSAMVNILSIGKSGLLKNGSGFVVTGDGLIVTYLDAIIAEDAAYKIFISDGSEYDAELAGIDDYSNLVYLRISKSNLPTISFVNSDEIEAGKKIIVLGNSAMQYQNQLAMGIISSPENTFNLAGKTVSFSDKFEGVLGIGADLSDRFIGGPAVDYNGDAIGLIGKIKIDNQDKYFIIPANEINRSIGLVINGKLKERAKLGIYYISLTKSYAASGKSSKEKGALIFSPSGIQSLAFLSESNGEKAGLLLGDIIISVDGKEVNPDNSLAEIISRYQTGDKAIFHILRFEKETDIEVNF
ncbi:MAG: DO Serine protease [Candidatus Moranbacteria bacterium GW2011_GWD2_37_9]|nr:MAG: DO Serine protease [Candidatus Moranbacteria bacterium GW2011_GWD2_37_9]